MYDLRWPTCFKILISICYRKSLSTVFPTIFIYYVRRYIYAHVCFCSHNVSAVLFSCVIRWLSIRLIFSKFQTELFIFGFVLLSISSDISFSSYFTPVNLLLALFHRIIAKSIKVVGSWIWWYSDQFLSRGICTWTQWKRGQAIHK